MAEFQLDVGPLISDGDGKGTITIRKGEASLPPPDPQQIFIPGLIDAPSRFVQKNVEKLELHMAMPYSYITVHRDENIIKLYVNGNDPLATVIAGKLWLAEDLSVFKIVGGPNAVDPLYSPEKLAKLCKFNKRFFADEEVWMQLVSGLRNYRVDLNSTIDKSADDRGSKKSHLETKAKSTLPASFVLQLRLFKGQQFQGRRYKVKVDVCFDTRSNGVDCWLESPELKELLEKESNRIMDAELKKLDDWTIIEI